MAEQFDVVVIGGGPGGYAAALYGAAAGMKVAMVEKDKLGGTCLNRGCIPAKEYLETASVYRTVAHASAFGISGGEPTIDFGVAQARKQKVVDQLVGGLSGLLKKRKVTVVKGFGRLSSGRTVKVDDGTELKAANVVLAAGSVPRTLPGFDVDGVRVHTSDEVLSWTSLPKRVAVVGGGVIGCEFASALCDLGCEVTILEFLPTLMPPVDKDIRAVVEKGFKGRGITIHTEAKVEGHEPQDDGSTVIRWNADQSLAVDAIVMSVGRRPYPDGLLDDGTGVEVDDKGFVKVDGTMRTSAEGIWAVGDLVNTPQLAHVAFAEAITAVRDALGEQAVPIDYEKVPWCVYSHPEAAYAGLTEEAARQAGYDIVVEKLRMVGNGRAIILGETDGLVKIVAEKQADGTAGRILGVHLAGPWVTEQLGQGYLAVNWEATVDDVAQLLQPHPTLSETFGEAVMALTGRGLHG
ncbi:MAG: dihydrolipoyl dehydrogenase [Acidimicrobiales bacterium]